MEWGAIAAAVVFLVFIANVIEELPDPRRLLSRKNLSSAHDFTGLTKKKLLTETEQLFLARLDKAFPEYRIFSQVQLSTFIEPPKGQNKQAILNTYSRQSIDFLICDSLLNVVAGIELDDKSHVGKNSDLRDGKKNNAFKSVGIPLFRWHAEKMPTPTAIRKEFNSRLGLELNS